MTDTRNQQQRTRDVLETMTRDEAYNLTGEVPLDADIEVFLHPSERAGGDEYVWHPMVGLHFPDPGNPRTVDPEYLGTLPPQVQHQIDQLLTWLRHSLPPENPYYVGMFAAVLPRGRARVWVPGVVRRAREAAQSSGVAIDLPLCSECGGKPTIIQSQASKDWHVMCARSRTDETDCWKSAKWYPSRDCAIKAWRYMHTTPPLKDGSPPEGAVGQEDGPVPDVTDFSHEDVRHLFGLSSSRTGQSAAMREEAQRRANTGETVMVVDRMVDGIPETRLLEPEPVPCGRCGDAPRVEDGHGLVVGPWLVYCTRCPASSTWGRTLSKVTLAWNAANACLECDGKGTAISGLSCRFCDDGRVRKVPTP